MLFRSAGEWKNTLPHCSVIVISSDCFHPRTPPLLQSKPPLTFQTVNNTVRDYLTNDSLKKNKNNQDKGKIIAVNTLPLKYE